MHWLWMRFFPCYIHTYIYIYIYINACVIYNVGNLIWFSFFRLMFTSMLLFPLWFLLLSCNGFFLTSILNPIFLRQMAWSTFSFENIFNNFHKHSHKLKQVSTKKVLSLFGSLLRISSRRKKFVRFLKYLREYSLLQIFK